jgi:flagellar M-ring protein FliF
MNINFRDIASRLSPRGWAAVAGSIVGAIIFIYVLITLASSPSYTTLMAGVNPTQTSKITAALSTAGIPYQLSNNGTAIQVQSSDEAQARVTLASGGLLTGTGGDATLEGSGSSSSLGESNFQQQLQYQSALESQLNQGIEQFGGINSAQVSIVLPDPNDELFTTSQTPSSASVIVNDDGDLSAGTAKSIAQYVKDSVPALQLSNITITDQNGSLLWPTSGDTNSSGLLSKEQAQGAYDAQMTGAVNAMLDSTLGAGKAYVEINADLNTNKTTLDSVKYGNKGTPLTTNDSRETLKGNGGNLNANGTAGNAATSIPSYSSTTGSGKTNYQNRTTQDTLGVNKTVAHTVVSPGAINRQSVSVMVSSTIPAARLAGIRSAVKNAVGFQATRGDTISVTQLPFAKPVAVAAASSSSKMLGDIKWVAVGLGALLFLLFVSRMLRRRENEAFGEPTWLRELETPRSLASLEAERLDEPAQIPALRSPFNLARKQVEELVDRDPERVAAQVRQWMNEG